MSSSVYDIVAAADSSLSIVLQKTASPKSNPPRSVAQGSVAAAAANNGRRRIRRGGRRRPPPRLRCLRPRDAPRRDHLPHGRLLRPHLRLRHWRLRWRDADGVVPGEVLPGGADRDEERQARRLLQVRQPDAHGLHIVAVHRRRAVVAGGQPGDEERGPAGRHAQRRRPVPCRLRRQRRRPEHRHAHHRPHAAGLRCWLHRAGGAVVSGRDVASEVARRVHRGVPLFPRPRHAGGDRGQLLHEPHPGLGLARLPRPGRRAGHGRGRGRALRPGHPQQPRPARRERQGARVAPADPRARRRHRRRVQGHRRGRRGGTPERRGRVPAAERQGVPALPGDDGGHPHLLRPHRHDRHQRLRARAVPDRRVRQPEGHPGLRHPQRREPGLRRRLQLRRGPRRPPVPVPRRRGRHVALPGGRGMDAGGPSGPEKRDDDGAELRGGGAGADVPLHVQLRHVVGAAQVGGAERDLPRGDQVGGAGHDRVHRALPLLRADAGVHQPALRHEVRDIPLLRRLGTGDDGFHGGAPAGDQRRAAGGHADGVGAALVLEEVRQGCQAGHTGQLLVKIRAQLFRYVSPRSIVC